MAKLVREDAKVFGSTAGFQQIAQFGSLAAGSPTYTTDPSTIQALTNYLNGWYDAAIGGNSPAIQDMNALFYLYAYQIAYLMQEGIAEWHATTTYYIGSLALDSASGLVYRSLIDNNLNQAFTVAGAWIQVQGYSKKQMVTPTVTVPSGFSMMNPETVVPATGAYLVQSGGSFYSVTTLTVTSGATFTVASGGLLRVI